MTHKLNVDIGNFKEGRVGSLVESPLALTQLTSHIDDPTVPERESVEETFLYFMPVIAANEPSTWRGTIIPVEPHEVSLMTSEGKTALNRAEVFDNARTVNAYLSKVDGVTQGQFNKANKRNHELKEAYPEQWELIQRELSELIGKKAAQTQKKFDAIAEQLQLDEDISKWTIHNIESYIAECKNHPEAEILITAMLNASNIHRLFDFARDEFINAS